MDGAASLGGKGGEGLVQKGQHRLQVQAAVQIDQSVGGVVEPAVDVEEGPVG